MAKFKIEFDREACIGAYACVGMCPENWKKAKDGKADLVKSVITEEEFEKNKAAAEACPVRVIKIMDEKGKQVV